MRYKEPIFQETSFNCPQCGAFAQQKWYDANGTRGYAGNDHISLPHISLAKCSHCDDTSIWVGSQMAYPNLTSAPMPNMDMPSDVKEDYEEARQIASFSPRGAAALLRLCIQKLCVDLGEKGKNINDDIASLVKKGLPERLQKALDSVRVIGNNAVHPGQIDLKDDLELTYKLFGFVNIICDVMITQPKQIDDVYNLKIPQNLRDAIDKRDGEKS